jgi:hypothetical protein
MADFGVIRLVTVYNCTQSLAAGMWGIFPHHPPTTMASLIDGDGNYYAQFYSSDRQPTRKRISLRTDDRSTARRRPVDLERAHEAGEYDPWTEDPSSRSSSEPPSPRCSKALLEVVATKRRQGRSRARSTGVWGSYRLQEMRYSESAGM